MNQRDPHVEMPDVQASADTRRIAIDQVGIKSIRHPIRVATRAGNICHTVGTFDMSVRLAHDVKGTHMSRFVELLEAHREPVSVGNLGAMLTEMLQRLNARSGEIAIRFPFFVEKSAPVTGVKSLMDYDVTLTGVMNSDAGVATTTTSVTIPVTSLCPCSKEISAFGAHNQRSHISITATGDTPIDIEAIIELAEREASSELYGILKRADEKFVTERAYENPKFVEDLVRDVAAALDGDAHIGSYAVEAENFESIHNHSAYARIARDKQA